jgi:calcineurin-like phosphoesterase
MGRVFMPAVDDPFRVGKELITDLRYQTNLIVVDVHAEATSEKMALARFFDGEISLLYGTHTHVQTADEQIFAGGTGYLTDVGMTGPSDGVIGMEQKAVIERFTSAVSERFSVQKTGTRQFCAAVVTLDTATGRALEIKRINLRGLA